VGWRCNIRTMRCYELVDDYHQQANARMARIDQVIVTIDVVDIHIIVVVPIRRPRFGVLEIIAAIIKAAVAALHMEMMRVTETGSKLLVRNTSSSAALVSITSVTAVIGVSAVVVLLGLLRALLVLRTVLLLCGLCPLIAVVLLLLLGAIILLRGFGAILRLLLLIGLLLGLICGLLLILLSLIWLFAFLWFFALLGFFLLFRFFLRFIFIGLLPGVARGADKENHHRCTKDEFHFDSSVFLSLRKSHAYVMGKAINLGLAGMISFSMAAAKAR
jgi:hypothetical protein